MNMISDELVQRRLETVASGIYQPEIPGLPGIIFFRMGLSERGKSNRAYASRLKELYTEGGWFSEAMIPTVLERACKDNGLDVGTLAKQREILRRLYAAIPPELAEPDTITSEEEALLSPEEKAARENWLKERGQKIIDFMSDFYTEDDRRVIAQAQQIEQLEQSLRANTAEHQARKYQAAVEVFNGAKRCDGAPYFSSVEDILALEYDNRTAYIGLMSKWRQWKEGLIPEFFRSSGSQEPGME